jgi:hypothetical protein
MLRLLYLLATLIAISATFDSPPTHTLHGLDPSIKYRLWRQYIYEVATTIPEVIGYAGFILGLLHLVCTDAEWATYDTNREPGEGDAIIIRAKPTNTLPILPAEPTQAAQRHHEAESIRYRTIAQHQQAFTNFLFSTLDPALRLHLTGANPLGAAGVTITNIMTTAHDFYGDLTPAGQALISAECSAPLLITDNITTLANRLRINFVVLANANQPICPADQMRHLRTAFKSRADYVVAAQRYDEQHPRLQDRSFEAMVNFIRRTTNDASPTPGQLGYTPIFATQTAPTHGRAPRPPRAAQTLQALHTSQPQPSPNTNYCYLHGSNGHKGTQCRGMDFANRPRFTDAQRHAISPAGHPGASTVILPNR